MKNMFFFLPLFIGLVINCKAQRGFSFEELEYYLPKKEIKFRLSKEPFVLNDTSIISPDAVYVNVLVEEDRENYVVTQTSRAFSFMRFLRTGQYM